MASLVSNENTPTGTGFLPTVLKRADETELRWMLV